MPKNLEYIRIGESADGLYLSDPVPTDEQISHYLQFQRDPVIGSQTGLCKFEETDEEWTLVAILPISLAIAKEPTSLSIDWEQLQESEAQGNALWKYSVGFLPTLLEASSSPDLVTAVLDSLWAYTQTAEWEERAKWMTSLDHCLAVRLRALCTLFMQYSQQSFPVPTSLYSLLVNDVHTLVKGGNSYFPINNHGAMAAIALIHCCAVFPRSMAELSKLTEPPVPTVGAANLERIINEIFDHHGIAAENSPEYQRYWLTLLRPLQGLFESFPALAEELQRFFEALDIEHLLHNIEQALLMFTDLEGRLIPIGDSRPRKLSAPGPDEAILISEEMGFAVYRGQGTVFTFNAGSTNYAHKHCDDTSITLSHGGKNIILDSGYYSHDWNDERTIFTKSQSAHSGLFLTGLDDLHPGKLYWPGKERIKAQLKRLHPSEFHVEGVVEIDGVACLRREVKVQSGKRVDIVDSSTGSLDAYGNLLRRLILPAGCSVSISHGLVSIAIDDVTLQIFLSDSTLLEAVTATTAKETSPIRGWISPELNTLSAATCLEIPVALHQPSIMRLVLS
ncbi:heparinase II/III family protein [Corynebacterium lizhenjunii]|uniref:Heparinase II/III family protein n=1 Tax=Corynebacterium lizhenjunii TaxID=2709394 RepID=A0A7T0KEQ0_9CORY|nr:heparinase II/III family protein [Corynebacterium lizhenjunii]QPK78589.1 heparinase II/III family protein [Corynebacterium lizhenjunii]